MHEGIPQGSVMATIHFLLYINDIGMNIDRFTDTFLWWPSATLINSNLGVLQNSILRTQSKLKNWLVQNQLKLNENKAKKYIFKYEKLPHEYHNTSVKIFGFHRDQKLSW